MILQNPSISEVQKAVRAVVGQEIDGRKLRRIYQTICMYDEGLLEFGRFLVEWQDTQLGKVVGVVFIREEVLEYA